VKGKASMSTTGQQAMVKANGATIPAIGFGTWELRGETCARIAAEAFRLGYRHVDTAQGYANEEAVGEGLASSGISRDDVFITTKVRPQLIGEATLERSLEESLKRLRVSQVDLTLIHWPNPEFTLQGVMRALSNAKRSGLTRHIGVSNFTIALLTDALRYATEPLVTEQLEYHPYLDQAKILAVIRSHGLAVTAYCPIALGKVVGNPVIDAIAVAHKRTSTQVALRWLIQQGDVIAIPRTSKVERLRENLAVFDFALTDAEMAAMSRLTRPNSRLINEPAWVPSWD
jgi:diketogulonate reductase-like aldo/keto reductase